MKLENILESSDAASGIVKDITALSKQLKKPIKIMEVCGTHTQVISQFGLRKLLPENVSLISGPGCPVCVTPASYIEQAIALAGKGFHILTFGDLLRVPSQTSSLEKKKAEGFQIDVVYSPLDAVKIAKDDPRKEFIFLAVGFETTIPSVASTIMTAEKENVKNFKILCAHKIIPPPLKILAGDPDLEIDGFICPGHVSVIIGSKSYNFLPKEFRRGSVVTGFKPVDILLSVRELVRQSVENHPCNVNFYKRAVKEEGNVEAQKLIGRTFDVEDAQWRGLGTIPLSGLRLKRKYERFDASLIDVEFDFPKEPKGCRCGDVLKGMISPGQCPLMARTCNPENPVGACMVSSEGSCAAYYKYERGRDG